MQLIVKEIKEDLNLSWFAVSAESSLAEKQIARKSAVLGRSIVEIKIFLGLLAR